MFVAARDKLEVRRASEFASHQHKIRKIRAFARNPTAELFSDPPPATAVATAAEDDSGAQVRAVINSLRRSKDAIAKRVEGTSASEGRIGDALTKLAAAAADLEAALSRLRNESRRPKRKSRRSEQW